MRTSIGRRLSLLLLMCKFISIKSYAFTQFRISERNRTFKDVEAVFRVPFKIAGMRGEHSRIGNGQHVINMVILDYTSECTSHSYFV